MEKYTEAFDDVSEFTLLTESQEVQSTYWMIVACLHVDIPDESWRKELRKLNAKGVGVRPMWMPLPQMKPYRSHSYYGSGCDQKIYQHYFCLPSSPNLSLMDVKVIVQHLKQVTINNQASLPGSSFIGEDL